MKFDVIVGNPPYNAGEKTIYHLFVMRSISLAPDYLTLVIPSRWFVTGRGLDDFRDYMRCESRIRKLVDYSESKEIFGTVDIMGGVCYFVWERNHDGDLEFVTKHTKNNIFQTSKRKLTEFDIVVRYNEQRSAITKVRKKCERFMDSVVSKSSPFGLPTTARPTGTGGLTLYSRGEIGLIGVVPRIPSIIIQVESSYLQGLWLMQYVWKTNRCSAKHSMY